MTKPSVRSILLGLGVRATRLSLRTLGFARTIAVVGSLPKVPGRSRVDAQVAIRWAGGIEKVSGRPYGGTCLDQSVFLWSLMHLHGLAGDIRIGINLDGRKLDGHAWVEIDGLVINDVPDVADAYEVFDDDPVGIVFQ